MAGDYIFKIGEFAEEMYFIKYGEVEVLSTDNETCIAILREGAYFGEIGLLITGKRTVTIRALTFCVFQVINKNDFDQLMDTYPEQKDFLMKVADQRIKTTKPEDLNIQFLEVKLREKVNKELYRNFLSRDMHSKVSTILLRKILMEQMKMNHLKNSSRTKGANQCQIIRSLLLK